MELLKNGVSIPHFTNCC